MSEVLSFPLVALAGSPNCGKTALFNALTGARQKVANFAGVTVERKEGEIETPSGARIRILDLPGIYSLNPQSPDERITRDVLLNRIEGLSAPDVLIAVADATNLERSLSLVLEVKSLGLPVVLALNMIDLASQRELDLDLEILANELGVPVVPTVAVKKKGITELLDRVEEHIQAGLPCNVPSGTWQPASDAEVRDRFREIDRILTLATRRYTRPSFWTARIDRVVLHPFWGSLVLFAILALIFQAIFSWAAPVQDLLEQSIGMLGKTLQAFLPAGPVQDLLVNGILAGVGAVFVFLPQILLLFFFILLLEDSGYMARAAFLMDRVMGKAGLHGRAFIPLLSSFACAIPGIMATRTIENKRDRLSTILVAPLMTCSARLPVYSLLIAAFIPQTKLWGPFGLQGTVMLGLYAIGIIAALVIAFVFKRTLLKGAKPPLVLELPTYKIPGMRNIVIGMWDRARAFIKRAGTIILGLTVLLWFLSSYPQAPKNLSSGESAIQYSYAGKIGKFLEPVLKPIGFDWRIGVALIPGFAAREVMVGALGTVYAVEASQDEAKVESELQTKISAQWSLATALSLIVWYIFAPQCLATLAVTRRETNSWGWPLLMLVYLTVLAYVASFFTFHLTTYLGGGGIL